MSTTTKFVPFKGTCRKCGHTIYRPMPNTPEFITNNEGIRVRCAKCGTTNHLEKSRQEYE